MAQLKVKQPVSSHFALTEHSVRTLLAHVTEIGLDKHIQKNLATYVQRPADDTIGTLAEKLQSYGVPLTKSELIGRIGQPSMAKREELTQLALRLGWKNMGDVMLSAFHYLSNNSSQHAMYFTRDYASLLRAQTPGQSIQDAGTLTGGIGAIIGAIGGLLFIAGSVLATPFMIAGAVVAGVGAVCWGVGYYVSSSMSQDNLMVPY